MDILGPIHQVDGEEIFRDFLTRNVHINFLRVCYVDYFNILRTAAIIPKSVALKVAQSKHYNAFASPVVAAILFTGELDISVLETGVDELHFDWSSLKVCEFCPGHAMVMTFVRTPAVGKPNGGLALDPRWQLSRQIEMAKPREFLIGHEIEFFLYSDATDFESPPSAGSHMSAANTRGFTHILDEIVQNLIAVDIGVTKYHAEDIPVGCFEIALEPMEPMRAADALVYAHELIRCVAKKEMMSVTFSPCPFERGLTMGSHLNLSIHPADGHEHCLAGILDHLAPACAILMPTYDANGRQKRMGTWVRWGIDNKTTVVRQRAKGFYEIRCVDATANPYLAAAVMIAAGMHGVQNQTPLTVKPLEIMSFETSDELTKQLGVTKTIPGSFTAALDELEADETLIELLGVDFVRRYLSLKRHEDQKFKDMTSSERRANLRARY